MDIPRFPGDIFVWWLVILAMLATILTKHGPVWKWEKNTEEFIDDCKRWSPVTKRLILGSIVFFFLLACADVLFDYLIPLLLP